MKTNSGCRQKGAVSLFTAVILLLIISLIGIITARLVKVETQVTADNNRANQALAAANAAMDRAVAYFSVPGGGLDQLPVNADGTRGDEAVDYTRPASIVCPSPLPSSSTAVVFGLPATSPNAYAQFYFDNINPACCTGDDCGTMLRGMAIAQGWSDDCSATRTITQCLVEIKIFDFGRGPKQPFVSRSGVGVVGNAEIINRYNNSSIWSGGDFSIGSNAISTWLRPSNTEIADYTRTQLLSPTPITANTAGATASTINAQEVSDRNSGIGFDIITNDPTLSNKSVSRTNLTDPAQNRFFDMFFSFTKQEIRDLATRLGQNYTSSSQITGKSGLIWFDTDLKLSGGGTIGSLANPVVLIVNGDLDLTGNTIHGIVYVVGELKIAGNPEVYGSMISESGTSSGAGRMKIVYRPFNDGNLGAGNIFPGGAAVSGSWKDWP